jgi:hypothetical protein
MQLDPHTDKKWGGGPDPGTPTGSPPVKLSIYSVDVYIEYAMWRYVGILRNVRL